MPLNEQDLEHIRSIVEGTITAALGGIEKRLVRGDATMHQLEARQEEHHDLLYGTGEANPGLKLTVHDLTKEQEERVVSEAKRVDWFKLVAAAVMTPIAGGTIAAVVWLIKHMG